VLIRRVVEEEVVVHQGWWLGTGGGRGGWCWWRAVDVIVVRLVVMHVMNGQELRIHTFLYFFISLVWRAWSHDRTVRLSKSMARHFVGHVVLFVFSCFFLHL
jgi:hypothetical protein